MCAERYRRQYEEDEKVPSTVFAARGTAFHRVAAEAHKRQMRAKDAHGDWISSTTQDEEKRRIVLVDSLPGVDEARDLAATEFEREADSGLLVPEGMPRPSTIGSAKDHAVRSAGVYVKNVAPFVDPVAVERKIEVRPKDSDIVVSGIMDLITRGFDSKGVPLEEVRDQKTTERSPAKDAAHKSQQLTFYAMLRLAEVGQMPRTQVLDYIVHSPKTGWTKHVPLQTHRTAGDIHALVERLNAAVEAVEKGVFLPTHPDNWYCSERWCPFWSSCRFKSARERGQG
jgi:hypothetical protein